MIKQLYDIAIVGAGPAGASAAIIAAKKGLKVVLLDREIFPRDKICGDQIILNAIQILTDMGFYINELLQKSVITGFFYK